MTTALLSRQYRPSLNQAAPVSRQNDQPRRSEAEPRWVVGAGSARRVARSGVRRALRIGWSAARSRVAGTARAGRDSAGAGRPGGVACNGVDWFADGTVLQDAGQQLDGD